MNRPTYTGKLLSQKILGFYKDLKLDFPLPEGIEVLDPYGETAVREAVEAFYKKYYADTRGRIILYGINPGRFGAGITGIPFTDPIRLERDLGIANPFAKRPELSSEFIYEVVQAWGGPEAFYSQFFISALSPLGFTAGGKNLNYYDHKELREAAGPYILEKVKTQRRMMGGHERCICLGEGTNYKYFCKMNDLSGLYVRIEPLPHPRWVMQYRRKQKNDYVKLYLEKLEGMLGGKRSG